MRNAWRSVALVALVAAVGAIGTLVVAMLAGMHIGDLRAFLLFLLPASTATATGVIFAQPLLARATFRQKLVALVLISAGLAGVNLAILTWLMLVSRHDAALVLVLMLYSLCAGGGTALVLARSSSRAIERLSDTARAFGEGDLAARTGPLDAGEELSRLASTLDDMADRLVRAQQRAAEVEAARRDLVTVISHDLRTPLASLRAMVEAIDEGVVEDPPSLRRYASEMRASVGQLSTMIDDLFELAQLDGGVILAEPERARLEDVIEIAMATVRHQALEKGLSLTAELGDLQDAACSPRLTRVVQNLLMNAIRHTPSDGAVRLGARQAGTRLEVIVEDTGEGIEPKDLARIFDPFFRADPARSGPGAGLGLTLAKRIIEAMGGALRAESRGVGGSRFLIDLPLS
jgi:signal transduction histidine kinase